MKKFLKRCSLPLLLFLTTQSCYFFQGENPDDLSGEKSDENGNVLGVSATDLELDQAGIRSYGEDIFNLTHKVYSHWTLLPNSEANQNGGFILHLDGYNGDLAVTKTTVIGSTAFEKIKKLVFNLGGLDNKAVDVQIKIENAVVKKDSFVVKNEEQDFELFIGGLDLTKDFEVIIKLQGGENYSGDLVVRDIHFSAALLNDKASPYVYDGEKEFSIIKRSSEHWEVNHPANWKYDNKLSLKVKEGDDTSLFAKTTVIGSEGLKKFKSLVFEIRAAENNTNKYAVKIVIGNEVIDMNLSYSSYSYKLISLEKIDVTKDFDIYFYPSVDGDRDMTVEIGSFYLTPYLTAPLEVDGAEPTFNGMQNGFYHWSLENDTDEEIVFHEDESIEVDVDENSSQELRIFNTYTGTVVNDYNKAIVKIKGPAGNTVKISPVFASSYYSYNSQYYFTYELTGEEQEIEIDFPERRVEGISFFPKENPNNAPGKFEVISVDYYELNDFYKLENLEDRVGESYIDITKDIKDKWFCEGNNVSIDENGVVTYDLSAGNEPLNLKLRRSHVFDGTDYRELVFRVVSDGRFYTASTNSASSNSGYVDVTPNTVQNVFCSIGTESDFGSNNIVYKFSQYSNVTPVIKILSVRLEKSRTTFTGTDYSNVASNYNEKWYSTVDYTLVDEKAKFEIPADGYDYYCYTKYRPTEQIKFNSLTMEFDALDKPLTILPKVDAHTGSEQVIPAGATSATFTLTPPGGNWYTYSDYRMGFVVKNTNDGSANLRLTKFALTKV